MERVTVMGRKREEGECSENEEGAVEVKKEGEYEEKGKCRNERNCTSKGKEKEEGDV